MKTTIAASLAAIVSGTLATLTTAAGTGHGEGDVWDSGRMVSPRSPGVPYAGPALESGHRYFWSVKVWDNQGQRIYSNAVIPSVAPQYREFLLKTIAQGESNES